VHGGDHLTEPGLRLGPGETRGKIVVGLVVGGTQGRGSDSLVDLRLDLLHLLGGGAVLEMRLHELLLAEVGETPHLHVETAVWG